MGRGRGRMKSYRIKDIIQEYSFFSSRFAGREIPLERCILLYNMKDVSLDLTPFFILRSRSPKKPITSKIS